MLDPVVQSALVVLLTQLLKFGAAKIGLPVDEATLNSLAVAIVALLLAQLGVPALRKAFPKLTERGFISKA